MICDGFPALCTPNVMLLLLVTEISLLKKRFPLTDRIFPSDVELAMVAGDAPLFSSHPCKLTTQTEMKEVITRVSEWNREHTMTLREVGAYSVHK